MSALERNKQIQLGFAEKFVDEFDEVETFPSKIGGKPVWLIPENIPKAEHLLCGRCGKVLSFLLQIYAPLSGPGRDDCFHRMIYVFCCRRNSCLLYKPLESMVALRAQLPRTNKYYEEIQKNDQNEQYTDYKRLVDCKR